MSYQGPPSPRCRTTIFITSDAVEFFSQSAPATVLRNHPGTFHVWRIMAHVLIMAAFQLRHPVTFLIQMKSSDLSLRVASHHLRLALWLILCDCYQAATADGSGRMSPMPGIRRAHPV